MPAATVPPALSAAETRAATTTASAPVSATRASSTEEAQGPAASSAASAASTSAASVQQLASSLAGHQLQQAVTGGEALALAVPTPIATPTAAPSSSSTGGLATSGPGGASAPLYSYMLLPQQLGMHAGGAAGQMASGPNAAAFGGTGGLGMHVSGAPGSSAAIYLLPASFVPGSSAASALNLGVAPPFPPFLPPGLPARASASQWTSSLHTLLGGGGQSIFPSAAHAFATATAPLPVPMPAIPVQVPVPLQVQPMFLNAAPALATAVTPTPSESQSSANQTTSSAPLPVPPPTAATSVLLSSIAPALRTLASIEPGGTNSQQTGARQTTDGEATSSRPAPTSQPQPPQTTQQQQQLDAVALQSQLQLLESQLVQAKYLSAISLIKFTLKFSYILQRTLQLHTY